MSAAASLVESLRRRALQATELANATCGTIRRKLLEIGALLTVSVRRIKIRHGLRLSLQGRLRRRPSGSGRGRYQLSAVRSRCVLAEAPALRCHASARPLRIPSCAPGFRLDGIPDR